ncbi:MAG: hypothetical protein HKN11_12105, partial [Rhizobiales bacterium]|nr:hypothetical protein [Hyphomicrobiales bacterium]
CIAIIALGFINMHAAYAETLSELPAIEAGAQTRGGVANNAAVLIVSNLADSGPGSLRVAVENQGPRVIVFTISGIIRLKSDLPITSPFITIAGQTAPSPGITIQGAKLTVLTHNVILQHLAFRPGTSIDPEINRNRDAVSIGRCVDCRQPTQDVRIENISASWAVDEVVGIWGNGLVRVTLRNSIISEGLKEAGHPKGNHSMGLLIGQHVQGIVVAGNLFASNMRRNPVISAGASVIVANNFIYNPGRAAIEFYPGPLIRASLIGNVVKHGPNSKPDLTAIQAPKSFLRRSPDGLIFADDNQCCAGGTNGETVATNVLSFIRYAPVKSSAWEIKPSASVWPWIKSHAGSRPQDRDLVDNRIVNEVWANLGSIIDSPADAGAPLNLPSRTHELELPSKPFATLADSIDMRRIEAWLCARHLEVGGPPTPECPQEMNLYREKLTQ